jgi:hypothetical protein
MVARLHPPKDHWQLLSFQQMTPSELIAIVDGILQGRLSLRPFSPVDTEDGGCTTETVPKEG